MYAAKRFAYSPPVYKARNLLAAIDYNAHINRQVKKRKDGTIMYHRQNNKKSARWVVVPDKVAKSYNYMDKLLTQCVDMRGKDRKGMSKPKEMAHDDPRQILRTLTHQPSPPPTSELVSKKKTRKHH